MSLGSTQIKPLGLKGLLSKRLNGTHKDKKEDSKDRDVWDMIWYLGCKFLLLLIQMPSLSKNEWIQETKKREDKEEQEKFSEIESTLIGNWSI